MRTLGFFCGITMTEQSRSGDIESAAARLEAQVRRSTNCERSHHVTLMLRSSNAMPRPAPFDPLSRHRSSPQGDRTRRGRVFFPCAGQRRRHQLFRCGRSAPASWPDVRRDRAAARLASRRLGDMAMAVLSARFFDRFGEQPFGQLTSSERPNKLSNDEHQDPGRGDARVGVGKSTRESHGRIGKRR